MWNFCDSRWIAKNFPELNALHEPNPFNSFDLTGKQNPVNLRNEQQKDQNIITVLEVNRNWTTILLALSKLETQETLTISKTIMALYTINFTITQAAILHDSMSFHSTCGKKSFTAFIIVNQMDIVELPKLTLFRYYFYFINFVEYLTDYIKNCSSCLQVKPIEYATFKPPFLSLATDQ